jgi:hypothetical protein
MLRLKREIKSKRDLPYLIQHIQAPKVAEIGVYQGHYAQNFIPKLNKGCEVWLIDIWTTKGNDSYFSDNSKYVPSCADILKKAYRDLQKKYSEFENVHVVKDRSPEAASKFPDNFLDWIYIDSNHQYECVSRDIKAWWPKLKMGGFMSGHDYIITNIPYTFGVVQAVNELVPDFHVTKEEHDNPSWWTIKRTKNLGNYNK